MDWRPNFVNGLLGKKHLLLPGNETDVSYPIYNLFLENKYFDTAINLAKYGLKNITRNDDDMKTISALMGKKIAPDFKVVDKGSYFEYIGNIPNENGKTKPNIPFDPLWSEEKRHNWIVNHPDQIEKYQSKMNVDELKHVVSLLKNVEIEEIPELNRYNDKTEINLLVNTLRKNGDAMIPSRKEKERQFTLSKQFANKLAGNIRKVYKENKKTAPKDLNEIVFSYIKGKK